MRVDWTPALGTVLEGVEGWSPDRYSAPAIDERHRLGPFVGDGVGEWSSDYSSTSDTDNGGLETPSSALFSVGKGDDTDNRNDSDLRLLGISIVESASNIDSEANSGCEPPACSVCCEPAVVTSLRPRAGVATLLRLGVGFAIWWGRRLDSW